MLLLAAARLIYFVLLSAKRVTVNFMRKSPALVKRAATFCSESQHNRGTAREVAAAEVSDTVCGRAVRFPRLVELRGFVYRNCYNEMESVLMLGENIFEDH